MALRSYTKPHASPQDWVNHLISRGLSVADPIVAAQKIELIGYHRLRIYFLSRRDVHVAGKPFQAHVSFDDILKIYECDQLLRTKCFEACGTFEVLFRNSMAEALSNAHGSHPYFELSAYHDAKSRREGLTKISALYEKTRDPRAKHYIDNYDNPVLPPIWTMKEFFTFGTSVRYFSYLSGSIKNTVANDFGMPTLPSLINWLSCIVDLRNFCAHHDRLFNRSFQKQPIFFRNAKIPIAPSNKLKAVLECLDWMIQKRGLNHDITTEVYDILRRYPVIPLVEVGY